MCDAIYIISNKMKYNFNLEKDVYGELAQKYHKNSKTIQSNIIKATNCIIINEDYLKEEYNLLNIKNIKITPKLVIGIILEKVNEANKNK